VNKPARIEPGARIGILAPAGCFDEEFLIAGAQTIRNEGFEVEFSRNIRERKGYLAGDEYQRAQDLTDFFRREDIDAIFCARGGFGSVQLLPHLGLGIKAFPKVFVGYSDISILLNWLLEKCGMVTFHGPMVAMELAKGLQGRSKGFFWGLLTGKKASWKLELGEAIRPGKAEAPMMGGCLSVLVTTLGTAYEVDTSGRLLFLEDVGEKPYRIERMLTHLKMAGKFDKLAGLVLGQFAECNGDGPRSLRDIVGDLFYKAPYPVVMGMAAGHGSEQITLPFGVNMLLDGDLGTLSLLESPVV
jgi:muramoyltetrapeptide carboxypeptidase